MTRARWPAEWEPHAATWVAWPHNPETWPGRLERATDEFAVLVRRLAEREPVRVLVRDEPMEASARRRLADCGLPGDADVVFPHIATDDSWLRDTGPIFTRRGDTLIGVCFRFDSWGGKYPPWDRDDAAGGRIAAAAGVPCEPAEWVLEGGAIDGNGRGVVLTTESCLLNGNRGPGRTREALEECLARHLGARQVIWLDAGIAGDDTDGHIDDVARFVDAGTVVAAVEEDTGDANFAPLSENLRRLRAARDPDGKPLSVVPLPMPPRHEIAGQRCPASYANFYLGNGAVLVPTFGAPSDERAQAVLREIFPGRDIVGVRCAELVYGLGAVHCLTQQQPA